MAHFKALLLLIPLLADVIEANNVKEMEMGSSDTATKLLKFSWAPCKTIPNPIIDIKLLSLSNDPIVPGHTETISFTADVNKILNEGHKLALNLTVETDQGGGQYVNLCPLFPTYCYIEDVCKMLSEISACPPFLKAIGLDCTCPIKAKEYKMDHQTVDIPPAPWIAGSFRVMISMLYGGQEAGCINMKFCLNKCA